MLLMTKKTVTGKFFFLLCLLIVATSTKAETLYVIDNLFVTLRAGQSAEHRVLKTLASGSQLELLDISGDYSHVRTENGIEGWILSQYLSEFPIARQQLKEARQKASTLGKENSALKGKLEQLTAKDTKLSEAHDTLKREHKTQYTELERLRRVTALPLKLDNENRQLKRELVDLENEHELLRQEYQILTDSSDREWFVAGAGAVVLGLLIGLIAPGLRSRKKTTW